MWNEIYRQIVIVALEAAGFTITLAFVLALLFLLVHRKRQISFSLQKWILPCLFLIYLLTVLGMTLFTRSNTMGRADLHLFTSYINAWNRFSADAWRMPLYNILMFVPLGLLLPLLHPVFRRMPVTLLAGAGLTTVIECTQYATQTGIFELDDLLNNFLGAWIGWGMIMAILILANPLLKKRKKIRLILGYLFPFYAVVMITTGVFVLYQKQPWGNLENGPVYLWNMDQVKVTTEISLSDQRQQAYLYERITLSEAEMIEKAQVLMSQMGLSDFSIVQQSFENVVFASAHQQQFVIESDGQYELVLSKASTQAMTDRELNQVLATLKIELPAKSRLSTYRNEGTVTVPFVPDGKVAYSGTATVLLNQHREIASFHWNVKTATRGQKVQLLSEQEAWEKVKMGWFRLYGVESLSSITLVESNLSYQRDTKNIYQPVYQFVVWIDEKTTAQLWVSAVVSLVE